MIKIKKILPLITFAAFLFVSCSSTQPINSRRESDNGLRSQVSKEISNRNDLKSKAFESAKLIHKLLNERQFEEVYEFVDANSALKLPKPQFLKEIEEFADKFGKLEKMEINEEQINLNNDAYEVKQTFTVKFENDPPATRRNETFVWKVSPDNNLKLLAYSTEIEK